MIRAMLEAIRTSILHGAISRKTVIVTLRCQMQQYGTWVSSECEGYNIMEETGANLQQRNPDANVSITWFLKQTDLFLHISRPRLL